MVVEQFNKILHKERVSELVTFLIGLGKEEKKTLATGLKSIAKEYLEYRQEPSLLGQTSYKQKATKVQADILYATAFVCYNRKDYQRFDSFGQFTSNTIIENILPFYCPEWFSDLVNNLTKLDWIPWDFDYKAAMNLVEKGYLNPTDELIVRLIPQMIFERDVKHRYTYVPENLEKWPITIEKHIWLIFQFESTIHSSDRYHQFQNSKKDGSYWMELLKNCAARGLMDRQRLLGESILAAGRNFNRDLSGWFVDLFEFMEPTPVELLALQPELISTLSSQHSKAVNGALNGIKEIVEYKEFNAEVFLESAPILLSSETKSIVSKSLTLLEKIVRNNSSLKELVCINVCQAFIQNDEAIQVKASKLLLKYYDGKTPSVAEEIMRYADSMLMSSKTLLAEFFADTSVVTDEVLPDISGTSNSIDITPVERVDSLDGLVFLASQSFDNNDPLHVDLLPAALVDLQNLIDGSDLNKFEPALQRAYTLIINDWPSTMGYLDHLLATFFIDVTKILIKRFPSEGSSLQKIHDAFKKKDEENKTKWSWYVTRILELPTWSVHSKDTTYIIHKALLLNAYYKIKNDDRLPILATPTHHHGFLDPLTLVNRLVLYQDQNKLPDNCDFQLALSRVAPYNRDEALREAALKLKGEALKVFQFVLDKESRPTPPYTTKSLWFMAGVTKSPHKTFPEFNDFYYATLPRTIFTGDVPWRSFVEHYKTTRYNFERKKSEEIPAERNVLRLTLNTSPTIWEEPEEKKQNLLSKLTQLVTHQKKASREDVYVLYEYLSLKAQFLSAEHNDIQRLIYLFPSNPNPLLALVTSKALESSTLMSEVDRRLITNALEVLVNLRFEFSEMTYLFVATCMLTNDKTVRSFAAELWIKGVIHGDMDSAQIGKIIGTHLSGEYAPMKRLTDLISGNLLKISVVHNRALELLLTSIIEYIQVQPPVGTKRLLELYSEVMLINKSSLSSEKAKQNLQSWAAASANLKKVINTIL